MVDWKRHRKTEQTRPKIDPIEIYESLDRVSEKGPLRPAQEAVLVKWHSERAADKDLVVKLHTGTGKTLVGLLMLQSHINRGNGPVIYVCPNRFLAEQTAARAKEFGFRFCITSDSDLPPEFLDGKSILITYVQKLFNGRTIFGLGNRSEKVGAIVIDDAHACIESIHQSVTIEIEQGQNTYNELVSLLAIPLEEQGMGEFADIKRNSASAYLPVPYWAWEDKISEVTRILANHQNEGDLKFKWPILKDRLRDCACIVSGAKIEITPYEPPLSVFGTYHNAAHRIFMSATISDDSYLIKALDVSLSAIEMPLRFEKEKWSGEKMVLFPSLIHESLNRDVVASQLAKSVSGRTKGVVALVPSFDQGALWANNGATLAKTETISSIIHGLRQGKCGATVAFANRYDGIDLPDDACRILIIDSRPHTDSLRDRYHEACRSSSDIVEMKLSQKVEQGMGRHIRGEKDYGVVVVIGPSLVKSLRSGKQRRFFSAQTRHQIEIGDKICDFAREDLQGGAEPLAVFESLIKQCIERDESWKEFYVAEMGDVPPEPQRTRVLQTYVAERTAERLFLTGQPEAAATAIQKLVDKIAPEADERGWYLQEMARYRYRDSKIESNRLQIAAHQLNNMLLKPRDGMVFRKLAPISERAEAIAQWCAQFATYEELSIRLNELLDAFQFGVAAERFENAMAELGRALGFATERPDRQWKAGPDVLWCVSRGVYFVIECKSEVSTDRKEIYKEETGQSNNSTAWFNAEYVGAKGHPILVVPARRLGAGAGFVQSTRLMRGSHVSKLRRNVQKFFKDLSSYSISELPPARVVQALPQHLLRTDELLQEYTDEPRS